MELSADQVIEIHNDIIRDFGGEPSLRDPATLDTSFTKWTVHATPKGRLSLFLIEYVPNTFVDGNKLTALVIADNLLREHY